MAAKKKVSGKGLTGGPLSLAGPPDERGGEPLLEINQIQGNIFPGFSKDHQTLLFLRIDDPDAFRVWLAGILPQVATTEFVMAFNRLFKGLIAKEKEERGKLRV